MFSEHQSYDDRVAVDHLTLWVRPEKEGLAGSCQCVNMAVLRHNNSPPFKVSTRFSQIAAVCHHDDVPV